MKRALLCLLLLSACGKQEQRVSRGDATAPTNAGKALDEKAIREGFERFKADKHAKELADIEAKHALEATALQAFVETTLRRMVFDGDQLSELFAPQELGWKARTKAELTLMEELTPLLKKLAQGREISGLGAYEQ